MSPATGRRVRNERWGKGKRWQARWVGADGREHVQACTTHDEATDLVAARQLGLNPPRGAAPLFKAYAQRWLGRQLHYRPSTRASTAQRVDGHLVPVLGSRRLDEITRADVLDLMAELAKSLSPATVQVVYSHLTSIMSAAVADGLIDRNPCVGVRLPAKPRQRPYLLTTTQIEQIAAAMTPAGRSMVLVGAATGLRPGELRALTWDRISADGVVLVDRQLDDAGNWAPPKTPAAVRSVPMGARVWGQLEPLRAGPGELVWRSRTGSRLTRSTMGDRWRDAAAGLGLPARSGWHMLRHYHASLLIGAGLSPRAVADRLGACGCVGNDGDLRPSVADRSGAGGGCGRGRTGPNPVTVW